MSTKFFYADVIISVFFLIIFLVCFFCSYNARRRCILTTYRLLTDYEEEHYDSSEKAKNLQQEVCTIMKEAKK